jgi:hypothetical protein
VAGPPKDADESRRALFRRMERVFVYGPPIALVAITLVASLVLALLVPLDGTTYWQRFGLAFLVIFVAPLVAYLVRSWWINR